MTPARRRKSLRIALALLPLAAFMFWFVTAPAAGAVQRWVAGGPSGWFTDSLIRAAESYEAPLVCFDKDPLLRRMSISLHEFWRQVLGPPDTTP